MPGIKLKVVAVANTMGNSVYSYPIDCGVCPNCLVNVVPFNGAVQSEALLSSFSHSPARGRWH